MIATKLITKLFERRQFTHQERLEMRELYQHTEMLAQRMAATVPNCPSLEDAIFKLKESLAACETAVALNPKFDAQVAMDLDNTTVGKEYSPLETAKRIAEVAKQAHDDISNLAAHARR